MIATDDFAAALEAARSFTEGDMRDAMGLLDATIVDQLARGPLPRRYRCGVCETFGADFYSDGPIDLDDPRWIVWIYHEVPKADMNHQDQLHYGDLANEIYLRAIVTYRAAGWNDEAAPPDA